MIIREVTSRDDHLVVDIAGNEKRFHFFWLRDNCLESRSPNGQRLHESNTLDPDVRPTAISHNGYSLNIVWSDETQSVYPVEYLSEWAYDKSGSTTRKAALWTSSIGDIIARHEYDAVRASPDSRKAWLADVDKFGFSLLKNVPQVEETIFQVVELFGFVRETNYGRLFEVRSEEHPSNLAYTPVPLSVHTDNPYRNPCPTLQLLHCLAQAEQGGITAIVDGFHAAETLRREDPCAFSMLTENEVVFRYQSDSAVLENTDRVISLDVAGHPNRIRINNRSMAPLRLDFDHVMPFYEALFRFRSILEDERSQYRFHLEPGDLLLIDNERVLHGRIGESIGERHLQGCYADRDGLLSTLRMLESHGN